MTLRRLLGIELPVVQAPMAGVQGSALAIAVSNAGGLGSLPCAMLSADAMAAELAALRAGTSKPFNVNFFCHAAPTADERNESQARQASFKILINSFYGYLGFSGARFGDG